MDNYRFKRPLLAVYASVIFGIALTLIAWLQGILSPRGVGLSALFLWVAGTVVGFVIMRKQVNANRTTGMQALQATPIVDARERRRIARKIWHLRFFIALMASCLLCGLWADIQAFRQGEQVQLLGTVAGVVANVGFTTLAVRVIRRLQKNLE